MNEKYTYLLVVPYAPTISQNHKLANHVYNFIDLVPKQLLMFKFLLHLFVYPKRKSTLFFQNTGIATTTDHPGAKLQVFK